LTVDGCFYGFDVKPDSDAADFDAAAELLEEKRAEADAATLAAKIRKDVVGQNGGDGGGREGGVDEAGVDSGSGEGEEDRSSEEWWKRNISQKTDVVCECVLWVIERMRALGEEACLCKRTCLV
jgi:hypothetical protein